MTPRGLAPSRDELHRLRVSEHLSLPEMADRYGGSAPTVRGWLAEYDIVMSGNNRRLPGVTPGAQRWKPPDRVREMTALGPIRAGVRAMMVACRSLQ